MNNRNSRNTSCRTQKLKLLPKERVAWFRCNRIAPPNLLMIILNRAILISRSINYEKNWPTQEPPPFRARSHFYLRIWEMKRATPRWQLRTDASTSALSDYRRLMVKKCAWLALAICLSTPSKAVAWKNLKALFELIKAVSQSRKTTH